MYRFLLALLPSLAFLLPLQAQQPNKPNPPKGPTATPAEKFKIRKDFRVELLYSVPKATEGSWVAMCVDPQGRLIVADQGGGLFRVTPPAIGTGGETKVEKLKLDIGEAQGLLWAFDSLYIMTNGRKYATGFYRARDTDGDGELDEVKLLRKLPGGGEHGPHAILAHPDGKSLVVLHGNQTPLTKVTRSRVPQVWGEDHLLPRMPDGRGFMATVLGPGGAFYKVDPTGEDWELLCVGFRNQYDAAFNRNGDLFTYDADMEWDFNTPWYRPTRVCLVASGGEFGWRNGTGKWPAYYPDSLPAVVDIGPGSPTGVTFGYGTKFPDKYQDALFINDWSYGKLYAVHLSPEGSAYKGEVEEFLSASPLPLTDIVVNPRDGAMYFAIGGRGTQSGLYRVTYAGKESTAPSKAKDPGAEARAARSAYEAFHGRKVDDAAKTVWPGLNSEDRYLRYAARVAVESQDVESWRELALTEKRPTAAINALLALVRVSASDPFHRKADSPKPDPELRKKVLEALSKLNWSKLDDGQRLELLRVYHVLFNRLGQPTADERKLALAHLDSHFPAEDRFVNSELCQVLVYLEAPDVAARTLKLLAEAPTQEEQIDYAKALRRVKTGWTPQLRKQYFTWFLKAGSFKGGASFEAFVANIKKDAVATLSNDERTALKAILDAQPATTPIDLGPKRPFVKTWTMAELAPLVDKGLTKRDYNRGRLMFAAANCFACHRFGSEGGANGPDLTGLAGRFSARDLLESIVEPSKVISDQYASVVINTSDGKVVVGRIVNLHMDNLHINTDMLNPNAQTTVDRKKIETMEESKVSMMPTGLLDTLKEEEILDLMAFLLSRGDRKHVMFQR